MAKFDGWGAEGKKGTSVPEPVRRRAERNVFEALARAKMLMPYTAAFLDRMQPIASTRIETLAVSPDLYLIYNPLFFENFGEAGKGEEGMGLWEFGVTFLHESLHVVYKHFSRWDVYQTKLVAKGEVPNHGIWNKAGDCEINSGLIGIEPINPIKQRMFTAIVTDLRAGRGGYGWSERSQEEIKKEARRRADQAWEALPPNEQYPVSFPDWPRGPVSLPRWFWFPDMLQPPQPFGLRAENYYPFVPQGGGPGPGPGPGPEPKEPWKGYKVGDKVLFRDTGEEGVVIYAGPFDPENPEDQDVQFTVTNHVKEPSRSLRDAEAIKRIMDARKKAGVAACGCALGDTSCTHPSGAAEQSAVREVGGFPYVPAVGVPSAGGPSVGAPVGFDPDAGWEDAPGADEGEDDEQKALDDLWGFFASE